VGTHLKPVRWSLFLTVWEEEYEENHVEGMESSESVQKVITENTVLIQTHVVGGTYVLVKKSPGEHKPN